MLSLKFNAMSYYAKCDLFNHATTNLFYKLQSAFCCRQLLYTDVVIWSYTTVPIAFRLPFLCIFTARCYASAVLATGLCLSVCPSQVGVLSKRLNESSWFLACELPSTRPTLC